jgi:glutathione S-transferase
MLTALYDTAYCYTQALIPALEAVLRYVAATMLSSSSSSSGSSDASSAFSNKQHAADIIKCLEYLRDRVGVPRDMSYPAGLLRIRSHTPLYM